MGASSCFQGLSLVFQVPAWEGWEWRNKNRDGSPWWLRNLDLGQSVPRSPGPTKLCLLVTIEPASALSMRTAVTWIHCSLASQQNSCKKCRLACETRYLVPGSFERQSAGSTAEATATVSLVISSRFTATKLTSLACIVTWLAWRSRMAVFT